MATFLEYIDTIKDTNIRNPKVLVEFLRYEDETVIDSITGFVINDTGSINIQNKNGQRRSVSFDLSNITGKFTPSPDGMWLRQKIKISLGLTVKGEDFMLRQGVFVLEDPSIIDQLSDKRVSITASDKFSLADGSIGGETEGIYSIPVGTSVSEAVRSILKPSDLPQWEVFYDPIDPIIDTQFDLELTPYTIEISTGDNVGNALLELANMVSANVYYNNNGQLVFEKDVEDSIKGSQFDFEGGEFTGYNFMGSTGKQKNSEVYNAVLVVGANINGDIFSAYVENNNLLSDTSIPNVGWKRVKYIPDPNIYSDALALERAIYELRRLVNLQSERLITCVPIYHLDVDGIITLTTNQVNRERYVIDSIGLPIGTSGSMSLNVSKSLDFTLE